MKPLDFPLLADENIHSEVVRSLAAQGRDIRSVVEEGLGGRDDVDVLRHAHAEQRVVLTHDSDFGTLAYRTGEPFTGIVYLRPGHILPEFVVGMLAAIDLLVIDVTPPFLLVAERKEGTVRVRVRRYGGDVA